MNISYQQLTPSEALKSYSDWILDQRVQEPVPFFRSHHGYAWYDVFYPARTLILCGKLFEDSSYIEACIPYMDAFLSEQLPNDAFTAHYRRVPTERLSKKDFEAIMRNGCVNLADNGSNVLDPSREQKQRGKNRDCRSLETLDLRRKGHPLPMERFVFRVQ